MKAESLLIARGRILIVPLPPADSLQRTSHPTLIIPRAALTAVTALVTKLRRRKLRGDGRSSNVNFVTLFPTVATNLILPLQTGED